MLGVPYNIYFIISLILVIMASIVEGFFKGCFTGVLGFSWRDARVFLSLLVSCLLQRLLVGCFKCAVRVSFSDLTCRV